MRTRELIRVLPTQYKRVAPGNPLYAGHYIPFLGSWSEEDGWVKNQDLEYLGETLSCPIIAVVDEKIGKKELVVTINGRQAKFKETTTRLDGKVTLSRKTYEDAGTTINASLTIPRYTRPYGTFLVTGLGQNIWGINNITTSVINNVGKIKFYALASAGSRIIYWMGIHFLAEELRNIARPWIAPSKCVRCNGIGLEPDADPVIDCLQCNGYKYSGYSAIKYNQRKIGFDLGLAREILDWDNLTDADHEVVSKFINKCWTQKWWCTPTKKEIKRMFAHFYNMSEDSIVITERFNAQEPVWTLTLPEGGKRGSPFQTLGEDDRKLMRYIARSITPAGVSVFVGFFKAWELGTMDDFSDEVHINHFKMPHSSLEAEFEIAGLPRGDFYNGWTEATDHFERETALGWDTIGTVAIVDVNDMNRHMAKLTDNAYMQTGVSELTGSLEIWVHPGESDFRVGALNSSGDWMYYVEFDSNGFYDCNGLLLTMVTPYNDYHLRIDFNNTSGIYDVSIMREAISVGISYLNPGPVSKIRVQNYATGDAFIDAIGITEDAGYNVNDNWQRLHEYGWGINNDYTVTGILGNPIDVRDYYRRDRFWDLNDY